MRDFRRYLAAVIAAGWMAGVSGLAEQGPVISEFLASNRTTLTDEDGDYSDWIEIHNRNSDPVNVTSWTLTDESGRLAKWRFPATTIPGGGYLLVFASGKDRRIAGRELHANFSLDAGGEYLALVMADGRTIASEFKPQFPPQWADVSYGMLGSKPVHFSKPTPRAAHRSDAIEGVGEVRFSHPRGFHSQPFLLTIQSGTPGAQIRFTTNGSAPTASSGLLYREPMRIATTTVLRAAAFKAGALPGRIASQTYLFPDDIVRQSPDGRPPPGWPSSWGANVVDYGMDPEVVDHPAYRETIRQDLQTLPSFSVVMDLKDLFDPAMGIYANAMKDGRDWERPCSVELIHSDSTTGFQIDAGIRIRGGFSRTGLNPKHGFRLFFRPEYGAAQLRYPLFGEAGADTFESVDLRTFQNYSWSFQGDARGVFVRDQVARDAQRDMSQPAARGEFYHLYLNGQYWGLYNTDERPEASFGATYFGGRKEDYDAIKVEPFVYAVEATDGTLDAWTRLYELAKDGFESDAAYQRAQGRNRDGSLNPDFENLLDVDNLIDYMLVVFYGGDLDAPVSWFLGNNLPNNFYALRQRNGTAGFRFFVHDAEHTLLKVDENRTGPYLAGETSVRQSNPQWLFQRLQANAEFRTRVADRIHRRLLEGGVLTPEATSARFLKRIREMDRAVVAESARWGDAQRAVPFTRGVEWTNSVREIVQQFIPRRTEVVLEQLRRQGLYPRVAAPTLSHAGGIVQAGYELQLTAPSGTIFFTLDGSDPRMVGGQVSPAARVYQSPVPIGESVTVRARVLDGGVWSALQDRSWTPAQSGFDLAITELMYHPADRDGMDGDDFEFIELKNQSSVELDLSGVELTAGVRFAFPFGTQIEPGEFVVLVRNARAFALRYPKVRVDGVYSGQLSNDGEQITVSLPSGEPLWSMHYSDRAPWPVAADGEGFSLVPTNPSGPGEPGDRSEWRLSSRSGGSPGADDGPLGVARIWINEVLAQPIPPAAGAVEFHNPNSFRFDLGGWFVSTERTTPRQFRLSAGTVVDPGSYLVLSESEIGAGFRLDPEGGELFLRSADAAGNLTGFYDRFQYGRAAPGISFGRRTNSVGEVRFPALSTTTLGSANLGPPFGPVVFNEIQYHPAAGDLEFIELKNVTAQPVRLYDPPNSTNTWKVTGIDFQFPPRTEIPAGGLLLVVPTDPNEFRVRYSVPDEVVICGPWSGTLRDTGETVQLLRPTAPPPRASINRPTSEIFFEVVEEVRYRNRVPWPVGADGTGSSLERMIELGDGSDPKSWRSSPGRPSPGRANQDNRPPTVIAGGEMVLRAGAWPAVVRLSGVAQDDGLPSPGGRLAGVWSKSSGPADVGFADATNLQTEARFALPGIYRLRLSVSDGQASSFDDLSVVVKPALAAFQDDFDQDGNGDLVLQHRDGFVAAWLMQGGKLKSASFLNPNYLGDPGWQVQGLGDFNRDGERDLLLQHRNGALAVWLMKGTQLYLSGSLNPSSTDNPDWRVVAAADFDRDGRTDLLFQHTNGSMVIWLMDGVVFSSSPFPVPNHPGDAAWRAMGVGDFDGDGRTDIVFQHSDSTLAVWLMEGVVLRSAHFIQPSRPGAPAWRVAAVTDLNGDRKPDLVFQNAADDSLAVWMLDGIRLEQAELLNPAQAGVGWRVVAP